MGSSRFPGKPLEPLLGLALVLHVYERCALSPNIDRTVIATCDDEIADAVRAHGAEVVMTADSHPGCVDRTDEAVALIAPEMADDGLVLMVQGDEVLVSPQMCDDIIAAYNEGGSQVVNLASKIFTQEDHEDPNSVKVVSAPNGDALFFSRAAIPSPSRNPVIPMYQQTGVIGFAKSFLPKFGQLPRTPLEQIEGIDMLRTLEHGHNVRIVHTEQETIGVDTPEDLLRAEDRLRADPFTQKYLSLDL
jgi:3-deoxy-manno-octulosonate cytidylyltransferase (CMP-KDO synthetase)